MFEILPNEGATEEVQEVPGVEIPAEETEKIVEETPEEEIKLPPPRKQTAQERINEVTRKRREAEREVERLRQELSVKKEVPPMSSGRPRLEQFETQEAYEDAVADWKYDQRESQKSEITRKEAEVRAKVDFDKKAAEFKKDYEDFDEVIEQPVYSQPMQEVIFKSDNGAMLAYYLGRSENRDTADRIRALPERDQIYEMGKLEARLLSAKKNKLTDAPPPIKPVGETGGRTALDESKMTDQEWLEHRRKQRAEQIKNKTGV